MGEGRGEGKTTAPLSADLNPITDNRLKTYNGTTYYYDHFGNLIHRELANGEVQNYFYDLHDQLVKAEIFKKDGTKETWTYSYDALGRRIGKGRLKNEEVSETSFPHDLGGNGLENQTRFVWDGSHLLQEVQPDGRYTYIYTDPDSYEPLAQVHNWTTENGESRQQTHYFHCDQIGIPREMTDKDGNLLWFGNYTGWGRLKFVWDGSHLLQEVKPDGRYTYLYTDPDSYEPLAQVRNWTNEDGESRQQIHYFHCDQIGIPREMTDKDGNLLWFGNYTGWGRLKEETKVTDSAYQPFRLQNQYADRETGLHYNFFRYYEPNVGRFVNQDPIGLLGGDNLYQFAPNTNKWLDVLGLNKNLPAPYWPPNRGALGEVRSITLPVGTLVDRYGYPGGTFVSPVGTPYPMRALPPGSNQKPYTIYRVLKPIDNVAASKIMPWFGEIGLGTQYELPKSVKSYRIWASGRGENRKMLKINELNSYLKSKGVPEDSYSINEVNDESLCIVEENKKWHIFYSERGLRTEEYCYQDEHLAILYFINRLSKMLNFSFE